MEHGNFSPLIEYYCLCDYLLVAQPNDLLSGEIDQEKMFFDEMHQQNLGAFDRSLVNIAHFRAKEEMEETLIRWMQNICNLHMPFIVTVNNYSGLPPHSIYLRIQDPLPFQKLLASLRMLEGFIEANDCPPLRLYNLPHLTIAQNLPEHLYEQAIRHFAPRIFHASFPVDKLILLKSDGDGRYKLINTFILSGSTSFA